MEVGVIGLGTFGFALAKKLQLKGIDVVAIDTELELVEKIKPFVKKAVSIDASKEETLKYIGVQDLDAVVVAIGKNVGESIIITSHLKRLGVYKIYARALDESHEKVLRDLGIYHIFTIEESMAENVASLVAYPMLLQQINFPGGYSIIEIPVPKEWNEKTLIELELRKKYGLNVVAIQTKVPYVDESGRSLYRRIINSSPGPNDVLKSEQIVVLIGSTNNINAFVNRFFKEEK